MKNKSFLFSIAGSLLIIALVFIINITTSWSHPWFIYPTFAVAWWPLSMFFAGSKNWKLFALSGSILVAVFFILVNIFTSSFPWAIFPIFAVAWWPISFYLCSAKKYKLYSIVASVLTIAFFLVVNLVTSPGYMWFIYPAFAVAWWPLSYIICSAKRYKTFAVVASAYLILFLLLINLIASPHYIWFYYPAFALIWWPLSMFFARKKTIKAYSVIMSFIIVGFLALTNFLNTPNIWWFQWTIFYFLWWPIVTLLGEKAKALTFSIVSATVIIAYYIMLYLVQTPGDHPWYLYIILPTLWWPVTAALKNFRHTKTFLLLSFVVFTAYYLILNLVLSPTHLWIIYLIFAFAWAILADYFSSRKKFFALSIFGTLITIVFFSLINYMYSPQTIWAVYPAFALVWWPLSLYFFKVRKNHKKLME